MAGTGHSVTAQLTLCKGMRWCADREGMASLAPSPLGERRGDAASMVSFRASTQKPFKVINHPHWIKLHCMCTLQQVDHFNTTALLSGSGLIRMVKKILLSS
eukprot:jgi/Botrbrau1/16515/Bobra.0275s0003.1